MQHAILGSGTALFLFSVPASCFSLATKPEGRMTNPAATTKMDEYRGKNNWEGLLPNVEEPRKWDEGFRSFLLKYGMLNHVVYDVFLKNEDGFKDEKTGLRGMCRFDNVDDFSEKGLEFSYRKEPGGKVYTEYDFTGDYEVVSNLYSSPRSFNKEEDNWFGFMALSTDETEMVIVFRGTSTTKEWVENATGFLQQLDGEARETGLDLVLNSADLMCHVGFQQLYREDAQKFKSPKATVHATLAEYKGKLEKVTVVGHSLGGAMAKLCGIDLARSKLLGDVPILCIAWGAPKIGNGALATWVQQQSNLRVLRISVPLDTVTTLPPSWMWGLFNGGWQHMGTELRLSNAHMHKQGLIKANDVGANHNLQMYFHNIDPSRDVALMNKVGNGLPEKFALDNGISPFWHSQTYPRTIYK